MFDAGLAYVKEHPKIALAGGVGILGLVYLIHRTKQQTDQTTDTGMATGVSPYGDSYPVGNPLGGTQAGTIAGVAYTPSPPQKTRKLALPKPGWVEVLFKNRDTGAPEAHQFRQISGTGRECPSGYVQVVSENGRPTCVTLNEAVTGSRTEKATLIPKSKLTKQGSAGEGDYAEPYAMQPLSESEVPLGFVSPWTTRHALQLYSRADTWGHGTAWELAGHQA